MSTSRLERENAELRLMLRTSARRTVFWRDILRAVAPDTVKILLRSERATRRRLKNRETP